MRKQAMHVVLIPDSGTLLQLHRELRLESLFSSFATLAITDASVHELLRFCKTKAKKLQGGSKITTLRYWKPERSTMGVMRFLLSRIVYMAWLPTLACKKS